MAVINAAECTETCTHSHREPVYSSISAVNKQMQARTHPMNQLYSSISAVKKQM